MMEVLEYKYTTYKCMAEGCKLEGVSMKHPISLPDRKTVFIECEACEGALTNFCDSYGPPVPMVGAAIEWNGGVM